MGILRQPPADQDARHLANRSHPSPLEASSPQGRERSDRAYAGDGEEERRPPARQPREDVRRSIPGKKKCQRCHWRQEQAGGERPLAKVLLEVRLALGIHRQVGGCQEREEPLGEETTGDGERARPAGEEAARHAPTGHADLARGQGAEAQPQEERREEARRAEERAPASVHRIVTDVVPPEDKGRTAQHDPDEDRRHGDMQRRHDDGEGGREAREEDHDHEDEPDVIGLPDRSDRVLDGLALTLRSGAQGQQVPHAAAIVGATRKGVEHERHQDGGPERELNRHATLPGPLPSDPARSGESRGTAGEARTRG